MGEYPKAHDICSLKSVVSNQYLKLNVVKLTFVSYISSNTCYVPPSRAAVTVTTPTTPESMSGAQNMTG